MNDKRRDNADMIIHTQIYHLTDLDSRIEISERIMFLPVSLCSLDMSSVSSWERDILRSLIGKGSIFISR